MSPHEPSRRLELVDEAADHAEAAGPEGGVGGVESERRQEFAMAQRPAGFEHGEVALGEAGAGALIDGIERVHQAGGGAWRPSRAAAAPGRSASRRTPTRSRPASAAYPTSAGPAARRAAGARHARARAPRSSRRGSCHGS